MDRQTAARCVNDPESHPDERLAMARILLQGETDLEAVCEVDLHLHSFYSDGYHSPTGRVWEAWRRGMRAISITDHDNLDGYPEALEAGRVFGIDVIPGIEFYTDRPGIEILGFWPLVDRFRTWREADGGREVIEPLRAAKRDQLEGMIARVPESMARRGMRAEITEADVRAHVRNGVSTKGDISVIMWQKYGPELARRGIAKDVKDFQARFTTRDEELNLPLAIEMDLSPRAFVQRLRAWGALPGLSHPTELRAKEGIDNEGLEKELGRLAAAGLQTLEVDGWRNRCCPETGRHQTEVFSELMERHNTKQKPGLLPTNGSDDHNQPGEGLAMGCGKDSNLKPEWGLYRHVEALRGRALSLEGRDS